MNVESGEMPDGLVALALRKPPFLPETDDLRFSNQI